MRFVSRALSKQGAGRNNNEDSYRCNDELALWIVADGMGGHQAGEIASALAAKTVESRIAAYVSQALAQPDGTIQMPGMLPAEVLKSAIDYANEEVLQHAGQHENERNMGSTLTVAWYWQDTLYIGQVGDSRAYFIKQETEQLTEDHSVAGELLRSGKITPAEAAAHPQKNMLTRAIGVEHGVCPDILEYKWPKDALLLLCSDGLYNGCSPVQVGSGIDVYADKDAILYALSELSVQSGSQDDMTGVLVGPISDEGAMQ